MVVAERAHLVCDQWSYEMLLVTLLQWTGVFSGVAFLHSRNPVIVHGDLKPV